MKNLFLVLATLMVVFTSCKKENIAPENPTTVADTSVYQLKNTTWLRANQCPVTVCPDGPQIRGNSTCDPDAYCLPDTTLLAGLSHVVYKFTEDSVFILRVAPTNNYQDTVVAKAETIDYFVNTETSYSAYYSQPVKLLVWDPEHTITLFINPYQTGATIWNFVRIK